MAFNFDESAPADTASIPGFPSNERSHRAAVKGMVNVEHDSDDGRHKFGQGDATARDAISTWVDGSIWLQTLGSYYQLMTKNTTLGGWIEVIPPSRYANRDAAGEWSLYQYSSATAITPGGGSPNTIAIVAAGKPHRTVTLTANSKLSNPTAFTTSVSTTITLEVTQDGTGGWTLEFDTSYAFPGGAPPVIASAAGAMSFLSLTRTVSGLWLVTCAPDVKAAP